MIYLFITIISFIMGYKISSLYQVLKVTTLKHQINSEIIEDTIKKQYEKKMLNYQRKIEILEEKLTDLTYKYSDEDEVYYD